ncbi:IS3 family transposase [Sutcliffiella rhizosphaerae]|uniref:IS3 family transposase ISBth8 n=1 Tax=Sutcliffiella rhizosphaerae TaxID=2880967 RepID=A0ABM8YTG4_9BACI|nr:IS3 family transposase [Sutcliffiella rhizosphaerae]CAG9623296.1 IS3 family transposase ISBth8 [Sutcliffiella rhizosphaerae]
MKGGIDLKPRRLYQVIDDLSKQAHSIKLLCHLTKVSRSGYYKWVKRKAVPSEKQLEDEKIKQKIIECHKKCKGIYGYRRIQIGLKRTYEIHINHKKIQRLLSELGIKSIIRRKRIYYGKKEPYLISNNFLNRAFYASRPNEKWVTDITYLIFNGQKLYLSAIKDLYNNEVVAYQISRRNDNKLVLDTFNKAIRGRNVKGMILHSDQGYQYTSHVYNQLLKRHKVKVSMSRKGNCWDNASMESFFSHFKSECFNLFTFKTSQEVRKAIKNYILFYNQERFQNKLNNLTPIEYRSQAS